MRGSANDPVLGVLPNGYKFESPQNHLPKEKPCAYCGTCGY